MRLILVDMDNVIADQVGGFFDAIKRELPGLALPSRDSLTSFDMELNFPEADRENIKALRLKKGFFLSLPVIPGAKEGLAHLEEHGFDVRIVTAPTWEWTHCVPEKYAWVEEHLGRPWCGKMVLTRDKTIVEGDILIDDAPNVEGVRKPKWTHVLYDQPYNRSVKNKDRMTWHTIDSFLHSWTENTRPSSSHT